MGRMLQMQHPPHRLGSRPTRPICPRRTRAGRPRPAG